MFISSCRPLSKTGEDDLIADKPEAMDHSTPVAVVVVMIIVSVLVYPQHALDAANYATGHPPDSTAHDPADRSA